MKYLMAIGAAVSAISFPGVTVAQDASSWAGFYGGIGIAAHIDGYQDEYDDIINLSNRSHKPVEFFLGYNWALGNVVLGIEALKGPEDIRQTDETPNYGVANIMDLRGKIGYGTDKWLAYFSAGKSTGQVDYEDLYDVNGHSYGLGFSYFLSEQVYAGVEWIHREVEEEGYASNPNNNIAAFFDTVSVRFGFQF